MNKLNSAGRACAVLALCAATAITLHAQTFGVLHSFDLTDGSMPLAGLIQGTDGSLYGTTQLGGANLYGTVFKITPTGTLTTLYSFCSQSGCTDGDYPYASLVQGTDGNFYGTTANGGANGGGTVFKITPTGTLTTLYSFCPVTGCADGYAPLAGLVQGTDGNFYGTASSGGTNGYSGTIFKFTPTGTLTTLYSFCSQTRCTDGVYPYAELVRGTDGNFYGTTAYGGANGDYGTVFKVTPTGTLTTLYSFCSQSGCTDGQEPRGLIRGTDGNFYGTTAKDYGTVFKITPAGTLTTLYSFCSQSSCADGSYPEGGLVQDTNGRLYGTTSQGGASGRGTVFTLSMGLQAFVETQPSFGKVGIRVKILGTNLTGATSVTFNGVPATFTVFSYSLIGTTVPAGATTGTVQVTTPSGVLSSNVPFRVTQ